MENKFENKKVAVIGLGIEGRDAAKYLLDSGAVVTVFDKKEEKELDFSGIDKDKINLVCGKNYLEDLIKGFDYIVRSPGVYPFIPEISEARKNGTIVTSAIKIFFDQAPGKIIGVTGTKGKGTSSTLIYEILKTGGLDVYLAGNIGKSPLELLPKLNENSWIVMEMSSFQLIDMKVSPHIAVVLNITEDHLDWHKNHNEYVDAKKNIVKFQKQDDFAIINEEYGVTKDFAHLSDGQKVFFSKVKLDNKYKKDLQLRGEHNLENIAAAVETCKVIGVDEETIIKVVRNFRGLEHRLELVAEVDGVKYYNDSFATGPQPTIAAIKSFTEPETIILGGSDKGLDYKEFGEVVSKKENVKHVILIGETKLKIANSLKIANCKLKIINLEKTNMTGIVKTAQKITDPGGVVILSPASASFDMFKNYKDRGNQFKDAVLNLKK